MLLTLFECLQTAWSGPVGCLKYDAHLTEEQSFTANGSCSLSARSLQPWATCVWEDQLRQVAIVLLGCLCEPCSCMHITWWAGLVEHSACHGAPGTAFAWSTHRRTLFLGLLCS